MAFMQLQTEHGKWYLVETSDGTQVVPADLVGHLCDVGCTIERDDENVSAAEWREVMMALRDYIGSGSIMANVTSVDCVEKWGARYSAPGYMDATDWVLADTEQQAIDECKAMYGDEEGEPEDDDTPDEPEPDDYVTKDYRQFWQNGKLVVSVSMVDYDANPDGWTVPVKAHMDASQCWPNVWLEGERGGFDLLSIETGDFA